MKPIYLENIENIENYQSYLKDENILSYMVLIADKNKPNDNKIIATFNDINKPFFGGIFPEIIFENQRKAEGILIVPFAYKVYNHVVNMETEEKISAQIEQIANVISEEADEIQEETLEIL